MGAIGRATERGRELQQLDLLERLLKETQRTNVLLELLIDELKRRDSA